MQSTFPAMNKPAYSRTFFAIALLLLLLLRLGLQASLYASGFEAVTADEFGRIVLAARWAQHPYLVWQGGWLPFSLYLFGAAISLVWELLWVPRVIAILAGLASIVLMYQLTWVTFEDRRVALLSAIFMAANPFHVRLSSVPLTETLYVTLILAAAWSYARHRKSGSIRGLYSTALLLALANGIRFEAWVVTALFGLFVLGDLILAGRKGKPAPVLPILLAVLLPWIFPAAWLVASYLESGHLFASLELVREYKARWHAPGRDYSAYLKTFFSGDPFLTVLGPVALLSLIRRMRDSGPVAWYLSLATIPLIVFTGLHGGQIEPPGISIRYMSMFMFFLYPALAFLILSLSARLPFTPLGKNFLLASATLPILGTQLVSNFTFSNDLSANGLKVGQAIRQVRSQEPAIAGDPVMIELSYWEYLAIQVGANDVTQVLYDRQLDLEERSSLSLIATDLDAFRDCLAELRLSYVILKSPELKAVLEQDLGFEAAQSVNEYTFYRAPPMPAKGASPPGSCPLP